MADSKMMYCRLCKGPCDNCSTCLRNSDRFNPSSDMIKTALEKKGAFASSEFQTISSDPPEISVSDGENGGANVAVRLTSMRFIPEYRDPRSPERKKLEKAAREEIIRSFDLPRNRHDDIKVEIREGSVEILIVLCVTIVTIAAVTIAGLCSVDRDRGAGAPGANVSANGFPVGPPGMPRREPRRVDIERDIRHVGARATGAAIGATAGSVAGPLGMAVGGAIGSFVGGLFAR